MRYAWDGWLVVSGQNPYSFTPNEWLQTVPSPPSGLQWLNAEMNSPSYHAIYPPLSQWVFATLHLPEKLQAGGWPDPHQWWFRWRSMMFLSEALALLLFGRLLGSATRWGWAYAIHPLPLAEFVGNGHLDGLAMPLLLSAALLVKRSGRMAAICLASSIAIKAIPVVMLPAWWKMRHVAKGHLSGVWRELILGSAWILLLTLPLLLWGAGLWGAWESAGLFTHTFEFNASIYFVFRALGELILGYNPIAWLGPSLLILGLLGILMNTVRGRGRWMDQALAAITILLLSATTNHPWYAGYAMLFGVLTQRIWPVVGAATMMFSYGHYGPWGAVMGPWLSVVTYGPPLACALWEWVKAKSTSGDHLMPETM